jgi:type I restriction enzyme S subunit
MSFPRYPDYKDSGVEWLGNVPEAWEIKSLKFIVCLDGGAGFPHEEQHSETGTVNFFKVADLAGGMNESESKISLFTAQKLGAKIFEKGTIAFAKVGAALLLNRRVLMPIAGCVDNNMMVAIPRRNINNNWLLWVLSICDFSLLVNPGAVPSVNQEQVGNIKLPLPSPNEQAKIEKFLDHETAKIDALINEQKKLIELLKEKRQAVISHAVTKGIDPNVKMKNSGVEWLGEVPVHWEVISLKRGYSVTLGKMLQPEMSNNLDELLPYLRAANIQWNGVDTSDVKYMWLSQKEKVQLALEYGDLLVSEGGDVGRSCLWLAELDACYFQNSVNRVRSKNNNSTNFLRYWISTIKSKGYIDVICNKSTIAHFTTEKVSAVTVPLPPPNEQAKIEKYIDHETAKIDNLINEQKKLIELLQERRAALISAAVTGKIDVRNF